MKVESSDKFSELLSSLSIDEKIGQLNQLVVKTEGIEDLVRKGQVGSLLVIDSDDMAEARRLQKLSRSCSHGIPLSIAADVIHGCQNIFPIPLACATSWNIELTKN